MQPKISIVVPVYNVEEYLSDCLNSLIKQTLKNIEIICIDDESTDNSLRILRDFEKKDGRIKVFSLQHRGLGPTRNYGIKVAKGEYIAFIDSDDWMELNFCEKVYYNAIKNNSDLVFFNVIEEYEDHQKKRIYFSDDIVDNFDNFIFDYRWNVDFVFSNFLTVTSKLHRTKFLKDNNIEFPPFLFEDIAFHIETCVKAKKISYIPDIFYHYRKTNLSSIMSDLKNNECFCIIDIINIVEKTIKDCDVYNRFEIPFLKLKIRQFKEKLDSTNFIFKGEFIKRIKNEFLKIEMNEHILNRFPDDVLNFYNNILKCNSYSDYLELSNTLNHDNVNSSSNLIFSIDSNFFNFNKNSHNVDNEIVNSITNLIQKDLLNNNFTNLNAYETIVEEELFDWNFFKEENNYEYDVDPLLYYIFLGFNKINKPTSFFDSLHYSKLYNLSDESLNPYVYYTLYGRFEGKDKLNPNINITSTNRRFLNKKIKNFKENNLNKNLNNPQLIISLTSFPERMPNIIYTLYSLFNQTKKPNKIILCLSEEEFPNKENDVPIDVLNFKKNGLIIKWCENLKSYTKLIPTLEEYPNDIIVTADDDIYYPKDWLEILWEEHEKYPMDIIAHRSRQVTLSHNQEISPYTQWNFSYGYKDASFLNFFTGVGGVLYPPNSLHEDVFNKKVFKEVCPHADDIWFWAMAILNNTKTRVPEKCNPYLNYVNALKDLNIGKNKTLWASNEKGGNDSQLRELIKIYPEIFEKILEENN